MLNIDPQLFQPKVIRMQTTHSIGLPGHHIVRTTQYSNSQVMTGATTQVRIEANNNIVAANEQDAEGDYGVEPYKRRSFHEMDQDTEGGGPQVEWTPDQMAWSGENSSSSLDRLCQHGSVSMMSFQSTLSDTSLHSQLSEEHSEQSKEEEIISQLNEARACSREEASKLLLKMTYSNGNCALMRQCGCLPLLIDLLHSHDDNSNSYRQTNREYLEVRRNANQVLHNIIFSQQRPDDKKARREGRVLRHLEEIRDYTDQLLCAEGNVDNRTASFIDQNLIPSVAALMKLSFDEDHRHAMCQLGGLQAIAELLRVDHWAHGVNNDPHCTTLRRYLGMSLTNLTFGDGANKALLCSMRPFMEALVAQLYSPSEDLRQVTASVLRNLSWRADPTSKRALRDVGAVPLLVRAALSAQKDSTLKSVLSALWNLSAHCSANKADICRVEGALAFLVSTLTHKTKVKTLAIVENGGGILRNVSSHVAIQNEYRAILRRHNCLQILLTHLKSPSLTVVSNACGTLWNLSARNATDQRALWEMGAVGMLRKLVNSKHKMISMGSSAALKNLLSARPPGVGLCLMEDGVGYRGADAPSLVVRKQKALSTEIDQNLSETYDNTDSPKTSPVKQADQAQTRSRRHISPSAARYMANQRLKTELSLPRSEEPSLAGSYVVEEKHNGAFQVTKNAKQALNYRQGQQVRLQLDARTGPDVEPDAKPSFRPAKDVPKPEHPPAAAEPGSKLCFRPAKFEKDVPNQSEPASSKLGSRPARFDKEAPRPTTDIARNASRSMSPMGVRKDKSAPTHRTIEQVKAPETAPAVVKPPHESRIPLPKSSVSRLDCQRSQSASPVAQRRNLRQENIGKCAKQEHPNHVDVPAQKPVDITVTQPKWAWTASPEKVDNAPERPGKRLDEDSGGEDEVRVWRTEDTPSRMSSANDLEEEEIEGAVARCSLNIRTSTGVRMIRNHPLLANAVAHRAEEDGRVFEHRNRDDNFQDFESGKTVEFCVQSEYDIEDTLSLMSRSSSVASISSFDQQSFHEDESFASDLSHRTSGIESPSELSDSPCQTAPTSPLGSSNYISLCGDVSDDVQIRSSAADRTDPQEVTNELEAEGPPINLNLQKEPSHHDEVHQETTVHPIEDSASVDVRAFQDDPVPIANDEHAPSPTHLTNPAYFEADLRTNRVSRSSSSSSFSVEDISPSERVILEECIRAGMPIAPPTYQMLANASARRPLPPKDGEYENEEKGKEDERKAEKTRLFRIPESPGTCPKKDECIDDRGDSRKTVLDQMGNRRFEKHQQGKFIAPEVPNQLSFLMSAQRTAKDSAESFPHPKADAKLAENGRDSEAVPSQLGFLLRGSSEDGCEPTKSADSVIHGPKSTPEHTKTTSAASTIRNKPEVTIESGSPTRQEDSEGVTYKTAKESLSSAGKSSSEDDEDLQEKDIDCSESEEVMLTSSLLGEAREIAEALLLGGSTEDMTVSTLSCLSDIDNARPPSAMADLGCLSTDDSIKATHLLGKQLASKKSLLRELQMGRLASSSNDSPENLSLRSSCTSDLLGNVNPPSVLDDMSLTGSMGSLDSDSECEQLAHDKNQSNRYAAPKNQNCSLSERMHEAAAMAQLYAKELSAITGGQANCPADDPGQIRIPSAVQEVTIADVTDIGCDTVGSDTEVEEDLPCDDEDTLRAASLTKDEGSSENLTLTLSEEPPRPDLSPFLLKPFMTSEEFKALQENADMILNTLRDIEVSDDEGGHSGDLLEDETMSLVSNESDEECPSPHQRVSPRVDQVLSPTCNGMVGLPQSHGSPRPRKTSLPQVQFRRSSGLKDPNRYSMNGDSIPASRGEAGDELGVGGAFDSRTFTRKRSSVPKEMVPTVQPRAPLRSPSSATGPSFPKPVASKIAGAWKGRSKSADVNRNSKLKMAPPASPLHKDEDRYSQRSTPSPKSPLSRSNTFEKLSDEETSPHSSIRRPNSLALSQKSNSPRHAFPLRSNAPSQKPTNDGLIRPRTVLPPRTSEEAILSPSGNNPRVMNKIQVSNIPSRRSMIPTPAKIGFPEN